MQPLAILFAALAVGLGVIGAAAFNGGAPLIGGCAFIVAVWLAWLAVRVARG